MVKQADEFQKGTDTDISEGPVKRRGCTDILCLLLFIIHWVAAIWVCSEGFKTGNPNRLIAGRDFEGSFCGVADATNPNEKADYKYVMFTLNTVNNTLSTLDNATSTVLIQRALFTESLTSSNFLQTFNSVCVKSCPCSRTTCPSTTEVTESVSVTQGGTTNSYYAITQDSCPYSDRTKCIPANFDSKSVLNRYCIPALISADGLEKAFSEFVPEEVTGSWASWVGDIATAWWTFIVAFVIAVVIGFIVLIFMRYTSSLLVWVLLLGAFAGLIVGGVALQAYASGLDASRTSDKDNLQIFSYCIWGVAALYLLIVICQCKNIRIAVGIVKTASMFIYNTASVLLVPIIFWALSVALYVWFVFGTVYILSSAETDDNSRISWSSKTQYLFIYHFFSLLWNNAFLIGLSQVVLAGAVASWYFTVPNENGDKKSKGGCLCLSGSISNSFYNAIRYHLGSIAFGSLILAIVQLIKYMLMYLANQAKQAEQNPSKACDTCLPFGLGKCFSSCAGANKTVVIFLSCMAYLVACFEKCIKFINKNAYIQIALLGKNFCKSAYNAFSLVVRNPGRFVIANGVADLISIFGKLAVAGLTGLFGFLTCTRAIEDLSSPWAPTVVYAIIGFVVGSFFMGVFDMAVDATLQCFLADEELSGTGGAFTPEPLKAFISRDKI